MPETASEINVETEAIIWEGYRRWGYLAANLDPLGFLDSLVHPELVVKGDAAKPRAKKIYQNDRR